MHFFNGFDEQFIPLLLIIRKSNAKIELWKTFPPTNFRSPKVQQKIKWFQSELCVEQFELLKTKHTIMELTS